MERINQVLDAEQPDVVIFTGDVIYSAPADSGMLKVLEQVSKRKLPFVVTFGNHDDEQGLTRTQLYDIIRTVPGNLMPDRGTALSPDYVLTVKSSSDPKKDAALLYGIASKAQLIKLRTVANQCPLWPFSIFLCPNIMKLSVTKMQLCGVLEWKRLVRRE